MANSFATTKLIARQALPILVDNLVMPNLAYKDYSETFAMQGDTIMVRKPASFTAADFTAGNAVNAQDIVEPTVDVKLDKLATVDVNIESIEAATSIDDMNERVIRPAAVALAEKINADGLKAAALGFNVYLGTAGTTPDGLDDFAAIRKQLNIAKAPLSERYAVWDATADAAFTQIGNLVKVNESGTNTALREGEIGRVFGLDNYMSQSVYSHTKVATGTPLIDGAATAGAKTIHVDGLSAGFAVGDRFTIANDSTKYIVVAAGALETADQDITIYPALAKNAADNAAITVIGNATNNVAFHRNALAFVTRPLIAPAGADSYTTAYNGVSLRVVRDYDIAYKREKLSIDVLYGYKVVYPELGVVYLG